MLLLGYLMYSSVLVQSLGSFMYRITSSTNEDILTSFLFVFPVSPSIVSLFYVRRQALRWTKMKRVDMFVLFLTIVEIGCFCFALFCFSFRMILAWGVLSLLCEDEFSVFLGSLVLYHEGIFLKTFSVFEKRIG